MSRWDIAINHRRQALLLLGLNAAGICATGLVHAAAASDERGSAPPGARPGDSVDAPRSERMRRHFPNVPLQTHDGRSVRFYDDLVKGRKVIINFTFTSCTGTCPRTSANLARVQELLGDRIGRDIFIVSLSIDPEHDTPAALAEYARTFDARPGWTFATGKIDDINSIRRRLGLYDTDDITQHMGLLTFGNEPEGRWGATPALDTPKNILYYVLRRVDPFQYTVWPTVSPRASDGGSETER
jgi:protein SCO1